MVVCLTLKGHNRVEEKSYLYILYFTFHKFRGVFYKDPQAHLGTDM